MSEVSSATASDVIIQETNMNASAELTAFEVINALDQNETITTVIFILFDNSIFFIILFLILLKVTSGVAVLIAEVDQIVDDICNGATNVGTNIIDEIAETNDETDAKRSSCSIAEDEEANGDAMDESPLKKSKVDEEKAAEMTCLTSFDATLISE